MSIRLEALYRAKNEMDTWQVEINISHEFVRASNGDKRNVRVLKSAIEEWSKAAIKFNRMERELIEDLKGL